MPIGRGWRWIRSAPVAPGEFSDGPGLDRRRRSSGRRAVAGRRRGGRDLMTPSASMTAPTSLTPNHASGSESGSVSCARCHNAAAGDYRHRRGRTDWRRHRDSAAFSALWGNGGRFRLRHRTLRCHRRLPTGRSGYRSLVDGRGSVVADNAVGYSHVRAGSEIGPRAHIGNFAEIKNARLGSGVKVGTSVTSETRRSARKPISAPARSQPISTARESIRLPSARAHSSAATPCCVHRSASATTHRRRIGGDQGRTRRRDRGRRTGAADAAGVGRA